MSSTAKIDLNKDINIIMNAKANKTQTKVKVKHQGTSIDAFIGTEDIVERQDETFYSVLNYSPDTIQELKQGDLETSRQLVKKEKEFKIKISHTPNLYAKQEIAKDYIDFNARKNRRIALSPEPYDIHADLQMLLKDQNCIEEAEMRQGSLKMKQRQFMINKARNKNNIFNSKSRKRFFSNSPVHSFEMSNSRISKAIKNKTKNFKSNHRAFEILDKYDRCKLPSFSISSPFLINYDSYNADIKELELTHDERYVKQARGNFKPIAFLNS